MGGLGVTVVMDWRGGSPILSTSGPKNHSSNPLLTLLSSFLLPLFSIFFSLPSFLSLLLLLKFRNFTFRYLSQMDSYAIYRKHREIRPFIFQLKMNRIKTIAELSSLAGPRKWVVTSGGFDPLHIGHLRCIQESARLARQLRGQLIVIVNGDGFLRRKKGKPFMNHLERMEIIAGLRGVTYVVGWDDGSQTVTGAIEKLQPSLFTKGGDRNEKAVVPEFEMCEQLGCQVLFGVGGGKIQSSSELLRGNEN